MYIQEKKTGRSPKDKRVVKNKESENDIWWGKINIEIDETTFKINKHRAIDYFNILERIYVVDGFAGWDKKHRIKVRTICTRAYHALFMHNMLIRPTHDELENFGEPDYIIFNAGVFPANRYTLKMTSDTTVDIAFESHEMVILGTEYAGEMKKGVFTIMNYIMPKKNILSMHCSANIGKDNDVSILFGLSGTGKTTLSADPKRYLIGDDEHCWSDAGIFNIEGGCYAKAINLSKEKEPQIYEAICYGTVLENVIYDKKTREVLYNDSSITENTRASYPIEYVSDAKIPCMGGLPKNIIFLTCDAFGILPPVSKLTHKQAGYQFISGYTAKVAGTEMGITEPEATFSPCFGAAFMVWHPKKYADLLEAKMKQANSEAWLVNTGWIGGSYGEGSRIELKYTRAILDAIHNGALSKSPTITDKNFKFAVPTKCEGVPDDILIPKHTWKNPDAYDNQAKKLVKLFEENFKEYSQDSSLPEIT